MGEYAVRTYFDFPVDVCRSPVALRERVVQFFAFGDAILLKSLPIAALESRSVDPQLGALLHEHRMRSSMNQLTTIRRMQALWSNTLTSGNTPYGPEVAAAGFTASLREIDCCCIVG